jgi:hypothetical protein
MVTAHTKSTGVADEASSVHSVTAHCVMGAVAVVVAKPAQQREITSKNTNNNF